MLTVYYQINVVSFHTIEKQIQCFGKGSVLDAVATIRELIIMEKNDEILAWYGYGKYVLSNHIKIGLLLHSIHGSLKEKNVISRIFVLLHQWAELMLSQWMLGKNLGNIKVYDCQMSQVLSLTVIDCNITYFTKLGNNVNQTHHYVKIIFSCHSPQLGEWPSELRCCNYNRKVLSSETTKCLTRLRDITSLWCSLWPFG